jgi:antitoxin CptB
MSGTEPDERRRKRLFFRCTHCGIRELDLILGHFAKTALPQLDSQQLDSLEAILNAGDNDLYKWISGRGWPPPELNSQVMELILNIKIDKVNNCQK